MKSYITAERKENKLNFFLHIDGQKIYIMTSKYTKTAYDQFNNMRLCDLDKVKGKHAFKIRDRLLVQLAFLENEYGKVILNKTRRKLGYCNNRHKFCCDEIA